jgi:protein-disulfide isomerase
MNNHRLTVFKEVCLVGFLAILLTLNSWLWILPTQAEELDPTLERQILEAIRKHPDVILESVENYQIRQQEKAREAQLELLNSIQQSPQAFVADSPVQGDIETGIILIEFSDFQCPYCQAAHESLKRFMAQHSDEVTLVYKHYPLERIHPEAIPAVIAAWAAHQQHKFWEYQDFLFTHQDELGEDLYQQGATELGLNLSQFERDRENPNARLDIQLDIELANKLGISGTPFFVMGDETFAGAEDVAFFEAMLQQAAVRSGPL